MWKSVAPNSPNCIISASRADLNVSPTSQLRTRVVEQNVEDVGWPSGNKILKYMLIKQSPICSKKRRLVHLLEKHLCKPIFRCKYCLFTSNHDKTAVEAHQREKHAGKAASITSNLYRHKGEIRRLATECFSEPNLKLEIWLIRGPRKFIPTQSNAYQARSHFKLAQLLEILSIPSITCFAYQFIE